LGWRLKGEIYGGFHTSGWRLKGDIYRGFHTWSWRLKEEIYRGFHTSGLRLKGDMYLRWIPYLGLALRGSQQRESKNLIQKIQINSSLSSAAKDK
jgi:hypothetical protein